MDSEEFLNKVTLEYLLNPDLMRQVNNIKTDKSESDQKVRFYRRRICQLTKDMSKGRFLNENLKNIFINYATVLVYHFKSEDEKDILQEEYQNVNTENKDLSDSDEENIDEIDKIMMNKSNESNLNNFIIRTNNERKILPIVREANLKEPELKKKGIKKKNISLIQDGEKDKETTSKKEKKNKSN